MTKFRISLAALALALGALPFPAQSAEPLVSTFRGESASGDKLALPTDLPAAPPSSGGHNQMSLDDSPGAERGPRPSSPKPHLRNFVAPDPTPAGPYDFPGGYAGRFDGVAPGSKPAPAGPRRAIMRPK